MALNLGLTLTAHNVAGPVIRSFVKSLKDMGKESEEAAAVVNSAFKSMAIGAGGLLASVLALKGAFKLAETAGELELAVANLGSISRTSGAELQQLADAAFDASQNVQFTPTEATLGMKNLAQAGLSAREQIDAIGPALGFASAGEISVAQSTRTLSAAMKAFSLDASETANVADTLTRATQLSMLTAADMESVMGKLGRTAGITGQDLEGMVMMTALVRDTGVQASTAANSVSRAMIEIAKKREDIEALGISVTDMNGNFLSGGKIIQRMIEEIGKGGNQAENASQAFELLGRFGVNTLAGIEARMKKGELNKQGKLVFGTEAIEAWAEKLADAEGTQDLFLENRQNTFAGQLEIMKGLWQGFAIAVGEPFAQIFTPVLKGINFLLKGTVQFLKAIPSPVKKAGAVFVVLTSVLIGVASALLMYKAAATLAGTATGQLMIKAVMLQAVALAPVAAALGAVTIAAGLFFFMFSREGSKFGEGFVNMMEKIKLLFKALPEVLSTGKLKGDLAEEFLKPANAGLLDLLTNLNSIIFRFKRFFQGVEEGATGAIQVAETALVALFQIFDPGVENIDDAFTSLLRFFNLTQSAGWVNFGQIIGAILIPALATLGAKLMFVAFGMNFAFWPLFALIAGFMFLAFVWQEASKNADVLGQALHDTFGNLFTLFDKIQLAALKMVRSLLSNFSTIALGLDTIFGTNLVAEIDAKIQSTEQRIAQRKEAEAIPRTIERAVEEQPTALGSFMNPAALKTSIDDLTDQVKKASKPKTGAKQRKVKVEMDGREVGKVTDEAVRNEAFNQFLGGLADAGLDSGF